MAHFLKKQQYTIVLAPIHGMTSCIAVPKKVEKILPREFGNLDTTYLAVNVIKLFWRKSKFPQSYKMFVLMSEPGQNCKSITL